MRIGKKSLKKPLRAILPISAVLFLAAAAVFFLFLINRPEDMHSHIAVGCSVKGYSVQQDTGYITVEFDGAGGTIKKLRVDDRNLQKQLSELSEKDLSDIIGVNMLLTLPAWEIKSAHIDLQNRNPFELLSGTDAYDKYAVVTGISSIRSNS